MRPTNREDVIYEAVRMGWIEVRKDGSVWRVAQRRKSRWDGSVTTSLVTPRRIDAAVGAGYRTVKLMVDGVQTSALAHRLVWRAKFGPIPAGLTINHKNGNKADNAPENLELATYSEQALHAIRVLKAGRTDQSGEKNAMAKLNQAAVREIRRRRSAGERLLVLAREFGVSDRTISKIARGDRWALIS